MEYIIKGRGEGKTTELIKKCSENEHSLIVCGTYRDCQHIFNTAAELGLSIQFPITFTSFLEGSFVGKHISHFYIDNADLLLSSIAEGIPIKAITCTV